jgi:chorismate mutase
MKNSQVLKEIIVKADEESLNSAIAEQHIAPENIVSVILQPGKGLAIGDYEAKYPAIYRV